MTSNEAAGDIRMSMADVQWRHRPILYTDCIAQLHRNYLLRKYLYEL